MAELNTLGLTVDIGVERVARLRKRFPDIEVIQELDLTQAPAALSRIDVLVGRARHIALLRDADRLRWAQTLTAGADAVPKDDLQARGIVLTNGSGIHAQNLSEHLLMFMLAFARGFPALMRGQVRHEWTKYPPQFELGGQAVCVVGLGDIGCALTERAAALGMRVTGVRRRDLPAPPCVAAVAKLEDMDPLLAKADHIALCLPLTGSTTHIFDARRLALLKPTAYIYNIGRGELIEQDALIEALRAGRLAGAGLDVTFPEPLPPDHPLWELENVIITCHSGGGSPLRMDRFFDLLVDNIERYRAGKPLHNIVDLVEGY